MSNEPQDQIKLQVRKEELDINKKWAQTGEIKWHKEVRIEEKNIIVPVMHEELIIEKKLADAGSSDLIHTETIRIPLREERVNIQKQTFDLEHVEIYKRQLQETALGEAMLKKEAVNIKTTGNIDLITDSENDQITRVFPARTSSDQ
ncbi:MAG: YsnF/AvaK domain-containing protein [Syntrophomonadaceae bacterium]|nr:YsnF/AvaK domain-containing protein [Syntrophomonadaceae bacterium]MDD3022925.1 YsnF/AvaK domain-containing protein [Syntrophomonadaceae bacterium]